MRDAELLVFDDLSSALDVDTEKTLWERTFAGIREKGSTRLVVSQRREALRHAHQVLPLCDRKLAAKRPLAEILERTEEMRRLWEHQPRGEPS